MSTSMHSWGAILRSFLSSLVMLSWPTITRNIDKLGDYGSDVAAAACRAAVRLVVSSALPDIEGVPGGLGGLSRCHYSNAEVHGGVRPEQDPAADLRLFLAEWHPPVQGGVKGGVPASMLIR